MAKVRDSRTAPTKITQGKEEHLESVVQKEGEECRGSLVPLEALADKVCQEGRGNQESLGKLADL